MSETKVPQEQGPPVVLKLSDERMKAKKQAAKDHRDFLRDRQREKIAR
jgi:hypothetical protein